MSPVVMIIRNDSDNSRLRWRSFQGDDVGRAARAGNCPPSAPQLRSAKGFGRKFGAQRAHGLKGFRNFQPVLRVTIQDEEPGGDW
jgi:hypothetical protein